MDIAALIRKMDEQRTRWVPLPDGKRVQVRRPLETEMHRFRGGVSVDLVCDYVCGWDGFTEADLLGAAVGASDAVEFTPEIWSRVARDRLEYVAPIVDAIVDAISKHLDAVGKAAKN